VDVRHHRSIVGHHAVPAALDLEAKLPRREEETLANANGGAVGGGLSNWNGGILTDGQSTLTVFGSTITGNDAVAGAPGVGRDLPPGRSGITMPRLVPGSAENFLFPVYPGRVPWLVEQEGTLPMIQTDSEETRTLLGAVRAGDPQALGRLLTRHQAYLERFVELRLGPRLRGRFDPADVVQEAQLEAVRRLPRYLEQPRLPLRLWLRQLANDRLLNLHRDHAATARRSVDREVALPEGSAAELASQLLAAGSSPSQHLGRQELARRVREAMAALAEADREVLLLRHFEGLSNPEVAALLGISPAAVSKRYGRAVLRLHDLLFASGLTGTEP
jgi:RNA polymerase sigma-70 factor (ECF subfamily)